MSKLKVATVWLDGCSGCHMSFLDMDERLLELAKLDRCCLQSSRGRQGLPRRGGHRLGRGSRSLGGRRKEDQKGSRPLQDADRHGRLRRGRQRALDAQSHRTGSDSGPGVHRERQRSAADSLRRGAQAAQDCAAHPRVRGCGRFFARLPALGRYLSHSADRAGNRCAAGYFSPHPFWSYGANHDPDDHHRSRNAPRRPRQDHHPAQQPGRGGGRALSRHAGARL